jgi:phage tail sheath protein FI
MAERLHPGVYIEEVSGGNKPIEAVGTSTAGFIGEATRGIPATAQLVTSFAQFEQSFGGHAPEHDPRGHLAQAVEGFFNSGGVRAYVVRVLSGEAKKGRSAAIASRIPAPNQGAPTPALQFEARAEGAWSSAIRVVVKTSANFAGDAFDVHVQWVEAGVTRVRESFTDLTMDPGLDSYVGAVINEQSKYVRVIDLMNATIAASSTEVLAPQAPQLVAGEEPAGGYVLYENTTLTVVATDEADDSIAPVTGTVVVTQARLDELKLQSKPALVNGMVKLTAADLEALLDGQLDSSFKVTAGPSIAPLTGPGGFDAKHFDALRISISEKLQPGVPTALRGLGFQPRARGYSADNPANPLARPIEIIAELPAGSDGPAQVKASDYEGDELLRTGLHAFDGVDISMLALPGHSEPEYIVKGLSYCDRRGDVFMIVDGPGSSDKDFSVGADDAKHFIEALPYRSKNGAMFYPWLRVSDPTGVGKNPTRFIAPSGHIAGVFARTDVTRGVWKAPAGIDASIADALGLQARLVDADQDLLNPVAMNCLREFAGTGIVTWGSRTLAADPEWRYVPVRRTALFLEQSLLRGLKWAVFEPNDQQLWGRIQTNIRAFMVSLFRQGAFQGATPDEAFRVKCDRSTNPQEAVDAGIVTAQVAFAPLKPAEFVVIQISQKSLVS